MIVEAFNEGTLTRMELRALREKSRQVFIKVSEASGQGWPYLGW